MTIKVEFKVKHGGVLCISRHLDFTEVAMHDPNKAIGKHDVPALELPDSIAIIHDNGIVVVSEGTPVDVQISRAS